MILLAAALVLAPVTRITEHPDSKSDRVALTAVVRLPKLDGLGTAASEMLARLIIGDNDRFSRTEMRALAVPGLEPRAWVMGDHMALTCSVYRADAATGIRMLAAMATTARLLDDDFESQISKFKAIETSATLAQGRSEGPDWALLRLPDVLDLYRLVMRPENVAVGIGGNFAHVSVRSIWDEATSEWSPARARSLRPGRPLPLAEPQTRVPTMLLTGEPWPPTAEDFPEKLLALIGIGNGKGSSLFRVARVQGSLSYRQEAWLLPARDGFLPALIISPVDDKESLRKRLLTELEADVQRWDEDSLSRAKGYATALLEYGADLNPFAFKPSGPIGMSLEDRTLLAAYWLMKTESMWDPEALGSKIEAIGLPAFREHGLKLVQGFSGQPQS